MTDQFIEAVRLQPIDFMSELLTQVGHMDINTPVKHLELAPEGLLCQFFTADNLPHHSQEFLQQ